MQLSHKFESQREWQIKSKHIRNYDIFSDGIKLPKNFHYSMGLLRSKSVPWSMKIGTPKSRFNEARFNESHDLVNKCQLPK